MGKKFNALMLAWLAVSLLFWAFYLSIEFSFILIYPHLLLFFVGVPIWIYRQKIRAFLGAWKLGGFKKFLLLGYGMVLLEEVLVALVHSLNEGFTLALFLQRIGQFWAFNLLAFTGLILAWHLLTSRIKFSFNEAFYLVGIFGLFSERVIFLIFSNPAAFAFAAAPMIFVYGLILTPALFSAEKTGIEGKKEIHPLLKYALSLVLPFLLAIIPILILSALRENFPLAFPPPEFIPL
ncbi:MAG: hypothetical protein V1494_05005 [Candidatus Diapherotrites archaeon]